MRRVITHLLWLTGMLATQIAPAAPDGADLYTKHCAVCHNENGMGGIGLPLKGTKIEHFPRDYLFKTIRLGREGRVMPAFDFLSDAQVNAIVDHILSWKSNPNPRVFSDVAVKGDPVRGKKLFLDKCAECHGKDGKSQGVGTGLTMHREREFEVVPPALNNSGFLASASDQWIRQTIIDGRLGTSMPPQRELELSDSDVNDVVAYVRSFEQNYTDERHPLDDEEPTLVFESPYDFVTTVDNLKQALQGGNFRIFPDRYMEMGLAPDMFVNKKQLSMRFCNFNQLYKMINTEPRLGVVLPCRITVVEGEDGVVRMYVMNMKLVSRLFNNEQLVDFAEGMLERIMELIDEATL